MRVPMLALVVAVCAAAAQVHTPARAQSVNQALAVTEAPLTLSQAIGLAEQASPALRTREAQLAAVQGLRREAAAPLFNNPQLTVEQTRRRGNEAADSNATERTLGIVQPFETGGQQARRREAAEATIRALGAEIEDARRQARGDATVRFNAVLVAQRRVQIEERALTLFEASAQAVARRRAAGEDTRLDANVAAIEAERARNALAVAREQLLDARAELAATLQLPAAQLPRVSDQDSGVASEPSSYTLGELLQSVQSLPRVRALTGREAAARARLAVEQARRSPDVTVGVNVGREGPPSARERVTTLSVSLPLPVFNRNAAAIAQALSEVAQAEIERAVAVRDSEAAVRRLWLRLASQRERVLRLQQAMVPAAQENQQLAARSRQAGQIGVLDQLLVNRQALEAERELNDALADFDTTRVELERAAGWPQEGQTP